MNLNCTACGAVYPFETAHPRCRRCNEPLALEVDGLAAAGIRADEYGMLKRYADFLPFAAGFEHLSLGEGRTPLVASTIAARSVGIERLWFKNETQNPTWSFKDRGTVTGLIHAVKLGYDRIGTVSTGNMAASVAAYCAHAGLKAYILVSAAMPASKIAPIAVYDPQMIQISGDYGRMYDESLAIGSREKIYFINSDVPFRVEGSKTIAFEICEQMGFEVPDAVVVPTSAGGNARGILKGFEEFKQAGLIDRVPLLVVAQAAGCAPIVKAHETDAAAVVQWPQPHTIAHAIENPFPPSGNEILRRLKRTGGWTVAVSDREILDARDLMARDGFFGQPAAAVPLAAVTRLRAEGRLAAHHKVVCIVTGSGLKYPEALADRPLNMAKTTVEDLGQVFQSL